MLSLSIECYISEPELVVLQFSRAQLNYKWFTHHICTFLNKHVGVCVCVCVNKFLQVEIMNARNILELFCSVVSLVFWCCMNITTTTSSPI